MSLGGILMIIKADAAAVTLKRSGTAYNNDSININGKVPSLDSANAGYKGAGAMSTPFAVALSSSERNGFAAAALTALNDRITALKQSGDDYAQVLSDYFCDSEYALEKSRCSSSFLATSVLYGYGSSIVAARMGSAQLYRYSDGVLSPVGIVIKPGDDHVPFSSCELIENAADGDFFILCSGGVFSVLDTDEITAILVSANGSAKRAAQGLTAAALAKDGSEDAVSLIVLRIFADDAPAVLPILPVTPEEAAAAAIAEEADNTALPANEEAEEAEESASEATDEESSEEEEEEAAEEADAIPEEAPQSKTNKTVKRLLTVILVICGMIVLTFATYKIAGAVKNRISDKPETTTEETTADESTTAEESTTADKTTAQAATTEPATTSAQVFNPNPVPTTRRQVSTAAPSTKAPTSAAPTETTVEPTAEPENTTDEAESTSAEEESATATPETTAESNSTAAATTEHPSTIHTTITLGD